MNNRLKGSNFLENPTDPHQAKEIRLRQLVGQNSTECNQYWVIQIRSNSERVTWNKLVISSQTNIPSPPFDSSIPLHLPSYRKKEKKEVKNKHRRENRTERSRKLLYY